jgi:hypothetical protein
LYAKGGFNIQFSYYILPTPVGPEDTVIDRVWQDIDTNYPTVRAYFDTIEQEYGSFIFRKLYPHITDTSLGRRSFYNIWFVNDVNIDSVTIAIRRIPLVKHLDYEMRAGLMHGSVNRSEAVPSISVMKIIVSRSTESTWNLLKDFLGSVDEYYDRKTAVFTVTGEHVMTRETNNSIGGNFLTDFFMQKNGSYLLQSGRQRIIIILSD